LPARALAMGARRRRALKKDMVREGVIYSVYYYEISNKISQRTFIKIGSRFKTWSTWVLAAEGEH
jgi:hypothetical protein